MINYPKVSVVILNWNGKVLLQQFLPSVYNSSYPELEIVVGDNGSSDDSIEYVNQHFPKIRVIRNEENVGFAEGYNRILSQIDADYFVLLNSDVEVTPDWIQPVIRMMEIDSSVAAAQPKIKSFFEKGMFEYAGAAGGFLDKYGYPFCRGRIFDTLESDNGQYNISSEIFWASGAALFIKKRYWDEVGGFDPDFFAHMEEIDLCWRLKNRGLKIMYCPDSTVYHVGGGTLNKENPHKTYLNFRNNMAMLRKNLSRTKSGWIIFVRLWLDFFSLIQLVFKGRFKSAMAISKAHRHFFFRAHRNAGKHNRDLSQFNKTGYYKGSIVWQYFVRKKRYFSEIDF